MLQPLPYQQIGIDMLAANKRFFLFDDPGLGKTLQAIRAADKAGVKSVLAVVPANIVPQWKAAVKEHSTTGFKFEAISYDKARSGAGAVRLNRYDLLIQDEAHALKNRNAGRTKALYGPKHDGIGGIVQDIPYVWGLTGSPAPNNPSELWTHLRALAPSSITMKSGKVMGYHDFVSRFCTTVNNGFGIQITGGKNFDLLKSRLAPFMLRRRKTDPAIMKDRVKPIIGTLRLTSRDSLKDLKALEDGPEGKRISAALSRDGVEGLKNLSVHHASLRRITGLAKVSPVVSQLIDEFEGGLEKVVVIAYHTDVIDGIKKGLEDYGISCTVYQGGMTSNQKELAKETFRKNPNCKVFIGQITAAGTGTDGLQDVCKDILLVEYSWVPEENKQIIGRLDRLGQGAQVLARFVVLSGSLDEAISAAVARKTADITALFGG